MNPPVPPGSDERPSSTGSAFSSPGPASGPTPTPLSGHTTETPPPQIPDYELLRLIGRGSYGDVWLARNIMGAWRAVKIVYRSRFSDARPFVREFNGVRQFEPVSRSNPSQVGILQVGRARDGLHFYCVLELADDAATNAPLPQADPEASTEIPLEDVPFELESPGASNGLHTVPTPKDAAVAVEPSPIALNPMEVAASYVPKTLRKVLDQRGALPPNECIEIGLWLAAAVSHLHKHDLVHRDIKPSNIIFSNGLPKLADIGLVTKIGDGKTFVGTEEYVPPEGPGARSADVFALGKVLYQMLTGHPVQDFPNLPAEWTSAPNRTEFHELNLVILKACEANPSRRCSTADKLREELLLLQSGRSIQKVRQMEQRSTRARKAALAFFVAALAIGAGVAVYYFGARQRASREREAIRQAREETRLRESAIRFSRLSRSGNRTHGWSSLVTSNARFAGAISKDTETRAELAAAMPGFDATRLFNYTGTGAVATSVAFAPDGRLLTSGDGRTSRTQMIGTNGVRTELKVGRDGVVAWTADGNPLHLGAATNHFLLRNPSTSEVIHKFHVPRGFSATPIVALAQDGSRAAGLVHSSSRDSSQAEDRVVVWDTISGRELGQSTGSASALAFAPDGSLVAMGDMQGTIRVCAVPETGPYRVLPEPGEMLKELSVLRRGRRSSAISTLAFGANHMVPDLGTNLATSASGGWLLASGDKGAEIVIWNWAAKDQIAICRGSAHTINALTFHPDGMTLISCGRSDARLWDIATGTLLLRIFGQGQDTAEALAISNDGRRLAWGTKDGFSPGSLGLWELMPDRGLLALRGLTADVRNIWISPDSRRVAALADNWQLGVWDLGTGKLLWVFEPPAGVLADNAAAAFHPDGIHLAFAAGRAARLYDLERGRIVKSWELGVGLADQMQFDERNRLLLLRREARPDRPRSTSWWRLYDLLGPEPSNSHTTNPGGGGLGNLAKRLGPNLPLLLHEQSDANWTTFNTYLPAVGNVFLVINGGGMYGPKAVKAFDMETGELRWERTTRHDSGDNGDVSYVWDASGRWFSFNPEVSHHELLETPSGRSFGLMKEGGALMGTSLRRFAARQAMGCLYFDERGQAEGLLLGNDWEVICRPVFSSDERWLAWGVRGGMVLVARVEQVERLMAELNATIQTRPGAKR